MARAAPSVDSRIKGDSRLRAAARAMQTHTTPFAIRAAPVFGVRIGWGFGLLGLSLMVALGAEEAADGGWAAAGLLLVYVGALLSVFAAAFGRRDEGMAWPLLAVALSAYAVSAFASAIDPTAAPAFPSVADVGLVVFYPLAMATIVLLVRARFPAFGLVNWMDLSISAFAVAAVGALVLLPSSLEAVATDELAYVIGDLVLVGFLAAALSVAGRGSMPLLRLLGVGALVLTVADAFYVDRVGDGHMSAGTIPSIAWPIGVLILAAVPGVRWRLPRAAALTAGRAPVALPVLSAVICLPVAILPGRAHLAATVLAGVALLAVVARLSTSLREREGLVRRLSEVNDELAHAAGHDALTGLGNRDLLTQTGAGRGPQAVVDRGLVVVDLDEFKAINDTFGLAVGDRVLQAIADRLRAAARPDDLAVRLGGDEFAVLLSPADEALSRTFAARFLATLDEPLEIRGQTIFVRASVGIAVAAAGESLAVLMPRADASMHRAKSSSGVERVSIFDAEIDHQILENLALASDLRGAVARDELVLHYQPIVELATRRTVGFEALVRWQHPERGLVAPLTFIPLAEQGGLMSEIGQWILGQACRDAASWCAGSASPPYVSVNLSVRQLQDPDFLARFHSTVQLARLPLDRLVVEVTETALATEHDTIRAPLDELRRLGVRVYIDDFGTGYSSLGYIRDLPLDGVKLDRAFARDLTTSAEAWTLAQAIVALLDNLNLALTAEGIESAAQLAQLRSLGCVYAQGYYFARPQPADALGDLMPADVAQVSP
jgi:diguanylate cyclase (GGDEF)-like protein